MNMWQEIEIQQLSNLYVSNILNYSSQLQQILAPKINNSIPVSPELHTNSPY